MSLVNPQTGEIIYNANELAAMRNEQGNLRAERLTPEEEMRAKQEEMRAQQEIRIDLENKKKKESAWTETKLKILALQGADQRISDTKDPKEIDMPVGSIRDNLATVEPVLFERLGEPLEFKEDIGTMLTVFEKEKLVIGGNEMQKLNEYGKKYLLGLLIKKHIFEQGFSISIDAGNQPILRDERPTPSTQRKTQMKGLQEALGDFEFSQSVRNVFKNNDNSSLIAEYIASTTHEKHPNLVDYRNSLARKVGITSPNISPEQALNISESTSLTPEEKSFLLAWKDSRKDSALREVEEQQKTFVEYAQENLDKKTPETHLRELAEKPFTKSAQLLAGGAIGGALLYFAYKQMKKGGVWGTISGIIAGLIGGAIMLPLGDKAWNALGMSDALKNIQEGKPVDREQARDNPIANLDINIIGPTKDLWGRLCARLASGQEGIEILMNPEVGQNIATQYPVYSMLNNLNPDETRLGGKYESPNTTVPTSTIDTSLNKLSTSPNQKAQLNTLLTNTWERYKKTSDYASKNDLERKKVSLKSMLASVDKEDGWLNTVIDAVSDIPEKDAAMKVIGQNPKEWGKIPLKDIKLYFLNKPKNPGSDWRTNHPTISSLIRSIPDSTSILTNYFKTMEEDLNTADDTKTLQNFLLRK